MRATGGREISVALKENRLPDTAAKPIVSVGLKSKVVRLRATDGAPPVLLSASNDTWGSLILLWSEPLPPGSVSALMISVRQKSGETMSGKAVIGRKAASTNVLVRFTQSAPVTAISVDLGSSRVAPQTLTVSGAATPPIPTSVSPPIISGTAAVGETLTATTGTWIADATDDFPLTYSYRWERSTDSGATWIPIEGATAATYIVSSSDVGTALRVEVRASNASGSADGVTLVATAVVPAPAPPGPPTFPTPKSKEAAGVMFNCMKASAADRTAVFADLAAAGAQWVRINVAWYGIEPQPGVWNQSDGSWNLTALDDCVGRAQGAGIKVLLVLHATPSWAHASGTTATPPDDPSTYAAAVGYLAARYAQSVGAWEVWNEANISMFWTGSAAQYVQLLQPAYAAIKQASPNALVVFGGTAMNDADWIAAAYAAGAKGYFDVMATHPYPVTGSDLNVADALASIDRVRKVMVDAGDAKPIWFTEAGWSAPHDVTEEQQAFALTNALNYTGDYLPYVTNFFWFEAKNEAVGEPLDSWLGGMSLIRPDLTTRPALDALKSWTGR